MHKRILAIVTLLCAIPLLAFAAGIPGPGQQINTWVQSPGGSLQVDSYAKVTSKNGSQFLSYSSSTASNTVTILPAAGYFVNSLIFDGVPQDASSISTILTSGLSVTDGDSVWVSFLRNQLTFTVTSPGGCLVTPSGAQPNVYAGTTYRVFEFIPIKGLAIASITPASGSGIVYTTTALNVPNQKVVVTVSSITTSGITLTATVSGSAAASTLPTVTTNGVTTTMTSVQAARACDACHIAQGLDPSVTTNGVTTAAGTAIFLPFSSSVHKLGGAESSCANCHYGAGAGAHPGALDVSLINKGTFIASAATSGGDGTPVPKGTVFCVSCHNAASPYGVPAHVSAPLNPGVTCAACHTDALGQNTGTGDAHSIQALPMCIQCHSIAQKQTNATLINDNSGVRAITGEFTKWSHHVTGRAVQDSDCATCHMEGSYSRGAIGVNAAYHMADDFIHLRNCNTSLVGNQSRAASANVEALSGGSASTGSVVGTGGVQYLWNPDSTTPDHTAMDQFCMSCHNSGGAPTAIAAVGGANPSATALNPFGDTISNQYDQIQRPAVVAVFDQFDTGNTSHHAVRGQRYTSATLTQAAYNNISTVNSGTPGWKIYSSANKTPHSITNRQMINTMASSPFAVMNTLYTPLGAVSAGVADNSTLHCGDCHTVGQYKAGSTVNSLGASISQVIGAHGSQNEYLLRKPDGTEGHNFSNLSTSSTLVGISTTNLTSNTGITNGLATQNNLVCYLCHNANSYQPADSHDGVGPCLADGYNTAGLVGRARIAQTAKNLVAVGGSATVPTAYTAAAYTNMSTLVATDHWGSGGGANIFGNKCLNCHNSGATNGGTVNFGGIHGNKGNATYTSFSSAAVASLAAPAVAVTRLPYRFLPGLGNIGYNGGNNTNAWQQKYTNTINSSQGCYTLNGVSTKGNGALIYAAKGTWKPTNAAATSDNGVLGSWGACSDHSGTSVSPTSDVPTRTVIRPLTY